MSAARFRAILLGLMIGTRWMCGAVAHAQADSPTAAAPLGPPVADERIYTHVLLNEAEGRFGDASVFRWDGEAWIGTDTNRIWLKSEGIAGDGGLTDGDQELLYDRPITAFFDLQTGLRYDWDSERGRAWAAAGIEGLTPYLFETSATLYVSDEGHVAAKLLASYEELLTQRLILEPLLEVNAYSRPDTARDVGAGVSDLEFGVRLRYEIHRKLAPYLGVVYRRTYGSQTELRSSDSAPAGGWRIATGIRAWL